MMLDYILRKCKKGAEIKPGYSSGSAVSCCCSAICFANPPAIRIPGFSSQKEILAEEIPSPHQFPCSRNLTLSATLSCFAVAQYFFLVPISPPISSANTTGFVESSADISLPQGASAQPVPAPKIPWGAKKDQAPCSLPILLHPAWSRPAPCQLSLLFPRSSVMLRGVQGRQGVGRQGRSRWKTIGKTPNPCPA